MDTFLEVRNASRVRTVGDELVQDRAVGGVLPTCRVSKAKREGISVTVERFAFITSQAHLALKRLSGPQIGRKALFRH